MQGSYRDHHKPSSAKVPSSSSLRGKFTSSQPISPVSTGATDTPIKQLTGGTTDVCKDFQDGEWGVYTKARRGQKQSSVPAPSAKTGSQYDTTQRAGHNWQNQPVNSSRQPAKPNVKTQRSTGGNWQSSYMAPPPNIPPSLQNGWQWPRRENPGFPSPNLTIASEAKNEMSALSGERWNGKGDSDPETGKIANASSDDDVGLDDSDDELLSDAEYDSDDNEMDDEHLKKTKWFRKFFEVLDSLTVDQINEASRQWHCPACQGGPGAIDWYKGMQPLVTHAKTKGTQRVKLHRKLAELLENELVKRGTSLIPAGEAFRKWKGLREETADHEIVWPPMVVIQNTLLDKDDEDKWIGMGNQELLDYFEGYDAKKARHAYGPQGHRGMSILMFDSSATGYLEAERLHKHFADEHRDRDAWDRRRVGFVSGGNRILYGYLATKHDMDYFNQNHPGKSRLKFEMRSYQEMVVIPMKRMEEDNQQLTWYKNKVARGKQESQTLKETVTVVGKKLRSKEKENKIVREMSRKQHEESRKAMDEQEDFYRNQIEYLHEMVAARERELEKLQEQLRNSTLEDYHNKRATCTMDSRNSKEEQQFRDREIAKVEETLLAQSKGMEEYELERQELIKKHDEMRREFKRKQLEQEVALEEEFKAAMTQLLDKYMVKAQASSSVCTYECR